ncbi:MAG: hypothetical protein PHC98_08305 [Syntrophotalea acetylenica]|nr:hypothetical protein [Syntrophotalea acetylenica]
MVDKTKVAFRYIPALAVVLALLMGTAGCTVFPALKKTTQQEDIAYSYIDSMVAIFEKGHEFADAGLTTAADYPYGTAAASISAMRYGVDCLLEAKGEAPTPDDRLRNWDEIAALGRASPYPYVFEGIVLEAAGESDAAMDCYTKAAFNPALTEDDYGLRAIQLLDVAQLKALRTAVAEAEDRIFAAYAPLPADIPRSEHNFSALYLRDQSRIALGATDAETGQPHPDYAMALQYAQGALALEPFNGDNYAVLAAVCLAMEQPSVAIGWLNEGLFIDPENEMLTTLATSIGEVMGQ